ncbi:siderophore-interacting protein [Actinomadura atramentaria]|uniref:siderophore-interacting protein n=1 Tax=Actinomadura atramentaria TaxID=1990 RepID=UPI00036AF053|nr:siderophore-interacting protein [Actinomadura atramentaria]
MSYAFLPLHVLHTARLGPTMTRVTFGGERVDECASGGFDQRLKLFLPLPGQERPVVPVDDPDWFTAWRALDPSIRSIMRTYTVRAQRPGELDVDFALHGETGPASHWASKARPGDQVTIFAPLTADNSGVDFRPPPTATRILLAGDETALPAIGGILESLPADVSTETWIEVPDPADRQELPSTPIHWLTRTNNEHLTEALPAASITVPDYAWIAGESSTVKALRRHLVQTLGMDRRTVTFTGYWRKGDTEEDLLAEVAAGRTPHTEE